MKYIQLPGNVIVSLNNLKLCGPSSDKTQLIFRYNDGDPLIFNVSKEEIDRYMFYLNKALQHNYALTVIPEKSC